VIFYMTVRHVGILMLVHANESRRNTRKDTLNEPRTASGTHNNGGRTENTSGLAKEIEELKELLRATVLSRAASPPSAGSCVSSDRPLPAQQKPASKQISYKPGPRRPPQPPLVDVPMYREACPQLGTHSQQYWQSQWQGDHPSPTQYNTQNNQWSQRLGGPAEPRRRPPRRCFICGDVGHLRRSCPVNAADVGNSWSSYQWRKGEDHHCSVLRLGNKHVFPCRHLVTVYKPFVELQRIRLSSTLS